MLPILRLSLRRTEEKERSPIDARAEGPPFQLFAIIGNVFQRRAISITRSFRAATVERGKKKSVLVAARMAGFLGARVCDTSVFCVRCALVTGRERVLWARVGHSPRPTPSRLFPRLMRPFICTEPDIHTHTYEAEVNVILSALRRRYTYLYVCVHTRVYVVTDHFRPPSNRGLYCLVRRHLMAFHLVNVHGNWPFCGASGGCLF